MGFARYLSSRLWEALFLTLAASALAFTACSAFYATQPFQAWPQALVVVGACALLGFAMECAAYSRTSSLVGGAAIAAVIAGVVVACIVASPYELPLEDAEGNYALVAIVVAASVAASFLLSRTKAGSIALLVGGAVLCGLVEYLYWYGHVAALCVFLAGAVGLLVCSGYRRTLAESDEGGVAFSPVAIAAIGLSAAALLVGAGLYFAVVAPMNPPGARVKLVVEHMRVEEIYIMGTGSATDDETGEGGSLYGDDEEIEGQEAQTEWYDTFQDGLNSLLGTDDDQRGDEGTTTTLVPPQLLPLLIAALVALVVVAAVLLKKLQRKRRFDRLTSGGNEQAAKGLYLFFLGHMEKLKMVRPAEAGLSEYVREAAPALAAFEGAAADEPPAFTGLTDVYERAVYGDGAVSDDELGSFKQYYRSFYGNIRKRLGLARYALRYFFL